MEKRHISERQRDALAGAFTDIHCEGRHGEFV
jgi:hypothetical protein